MHSAFTRQFIFEIIPFIILFTTRELKFIDVDSASSFFNSVIGRSMIGMVAFTFATYTLSSVNPHKIGGILADPLNTTLRLNSFTSQRPDAPFNGLKQEHFNQRKTIEPNEKLLPYALIN
jgi:hypothetical protein